VSKKTAARATLIALRDSVMPLECADLRSGSCENRSRTRKVAMTRREHSYWNDDEANKHVSWASMKMITVLG
jgi:hypothetical protein